MTYTKQQVFDAVRYLVAMRGVEPNPGFVANELSYDVTPILEVAVEGRGRGTGVAIVRVKGNVIAHEFAGTFESESHGIELDMVVGQAEVWKRLDQQALRCAA